MNQVAGIALPELGSTTYVPGILYLLLALDRLFLKEIPTPTFLQGKNEWWIESHLSKNDPRKFLMPIF